jgi:hypothetical protein
VVRNVAPQSEAAAARAIVNVFIVMAPCFTFDRVFRSAALQNDRE